jgi:hypothetical protein
VTARERERRWEHFLRLAAVVCGVCVRCCLVKRAKSAPHTHSIKFVCRMKRAKRNFVRRVRNNFCINASSALSVFFLLSPTQYIYLCASLRLMYLNVWRKRLGARTTQNRSLCMFAHSLADTSKGHRRLISSAINLAACCEELPRAGRDPAFFLTPDMYGCFARANFAK